MEKIRTILITANSDTAASDFLSFAERLKGKTIGLLRCSTDLTGRLAKKFRFCYQVITG